MEPTDFKFLEHSDLEFATRRVSFSSFLPYYAYDEKENIYYNSDNTAGFIFECQPAVFLGEQTFSVLNSLFRLVLPDFSVVQFCLYADPNIMPILNMYSDIKQTNNILLKKSIENFIKYFDEKSYILKSEMDIPVRNYRLFVSVKIPQKTREVVNIKELYLVIRELLIGVGLYSHSLTPSQLLDFLRRLLNDVPSMNNDYYDNNMPINRQAIFSDTIIKRYMNYMQIGNNKYCKCITPKVFPSQVDALFSNKILGNYGGVQYDVEQYLTPYIYAVNVVYQNLTTFLHTKCNAILRQASWGSLALSLSRKKEEFVWATGELERGVKFMRIMPIFIVFSRQLEDLQKVVTRAKRIWESQGCIMQADEGILSVLFLSSLPFGLYANKENLLSIDRDFIVQNDLIPYIVPTQVDFVGYGAPVMVFSSRKGQIATLNLFEKSAPNYNLYVAATSGGGKSFFINKLVTDNYAMGAKVRIIDIGGSYKKQCKIFNGQYIDFSSRSDVCLNPFSNITKEEVIGDIVTISAIVMRMIFSATAVPTDSTSESIYSIISAAVKWAIDEKGNEASIDTVYEYLSNFSKYAIDFDCPDKTSCGEDFKKIAQVAAFNLQSFTSDGVYGKWFNGKATLDISKDDFVVLELEHLKSQKELFNVVTLQVVNIVTQDLYLGDRSKRGLIIFEEAWQFLTAEGMLAQVIEEGYRRARKYGGSFSIVTQSIMDLHLFGKVGTIINSNSAFKIFLESSDFEKAKMEKLIDYDDFTMELLKSLKSNIPKYSELFLHTPGGCGIVRLSVDPFSYYVYTSNPSEFAKIEELVNQGWTYDKAIEKLIL